MPDETSLLKGKEEARSSSSELAPTLAPVVETVSLLTGSAELHPIVRLPSQETPPPTFRGIPNPRPFQYPATPLLIRSSRFGKIDSSKDYQIHKAFVPAPLRIVSKSSKGEEVEVDYSTGSAVNTIQDQSKIQAVSTALPTPSLDKEELASHGKVAILRDQVERRTRKTLTPAIKIPQPPIQSHPPSLRISPMKRELDTLVQHIEARATRIPRVPRAVYNKNQAGRSVASESPQPTDERVKDNRHSQSAPISPTFSTSSTDISNLESLIDSSQISDWIDRTMERFPGQFPVNFNSLSNSQSNAIIMGDGRLSPTKDGSYGRSGRVNIEHNDQRATSVSGIIDDVQLLSPSVYSPEFQVSELAPASSSRPSYRYLLENSKLSGEQSDNEKTTSLQSSAENQKDKSHKHPANYVTAHLKTRNNNRAKNNRQRSSLSPRNDLIDDKSSSKTQHPPLRNTAQAKKSSAFNSYDHIAPASKSARESTTLHPFGRSQDVRNQENLFTDHNSSMSHMKNAGTKGSDASLGSIPIYLEGYGNDIQPGYPQLPLHPSYGAMPISPSSNAFAMTPPSPYGQNLVPPPPSHLNPPGTTADDMYRHFISLHHELATDTSALKNMITAKHDNIIDRIYQKHDSVVERLGQGLLQSQHFLHDLSNHLTHVDANFASSAAGLDVRMRLVQDAIAATAEGQDKFSDEVQKLAKDSGDILNLLNAVNQRFTALEVAVEAGKCSCGAVAKQGAGNTGLRGLEGQQRGPQAKSIRKNQATNISAGHDSNARLASSSAGTGNTGLRHAVTDATRLVEPDIREHPAFSGIVAAESSPMVDGDWYRQVTGKST